MPAPSSSSASRLRRVAAVLVGLLIAAVLSEVALRLGSGGEYYPYAPGSLRVVHPAESLTPGVSDPSYISINAFGTRGPEPAGEAVRVLTVGGSTTACTVLDEEETWPALLMRYLGEAAPPGPTVWVTNSGIDGVDSYHHVVHAEHLLPRIPELDYAIYYVGINDLYRWVRSEDEGRDLLADPSDYAGVVDRAFDVADHFDESVPWYRRLRLFQLGRRLESIWKSRRAQQERAAGRIEQTPDLLWLDLERARRRDAPIERLPAEKLTRLPAGLDAYERNLRRIIDATRRAGCEPIFLTQAALGRDATEEERGLLWLGALDRAGTAYLEHEQGVELLERFNERLIAVAESEGARVFDLAATMRGERGVFYDDCHFNERGARIAALALADFLAGTLKPDPLGVR